MTNYAEEWLIWEMTVTNELQNMRIESFFFLNKFNDSTKHLKSKLTNMKMQFKVKETN